MIEHLQNRTAWTSIGCTISDTILVEQYLLAACLDVHRYRRESKYKDVEIQYLFDSSDESFDEAKAANLGYTHLIGGAKSNPAILQRLEERVRQHYPKYYETCKKIGAVLSEDQGWPR